MENAIFAFIYFPIIFKNLNLLKKNPQVLKFSSQVFKLKKNKKPYYLLKTFIKALESPKIQIKTD
jgi:hypothetical protein